MRNDDIRWIERNSALMMEAMANFFESPGGRKLLGEVVRKLAGARGGAHRGPGP